MDAFDLTLAGSLGLNAVLIWHVLGLRDEVDDLNYTLGKAFESLRGWQDWAAKQYLDTNTEQPQ